MTEPYEPLYTAAEMRAAEERYPGYPDSIPELMERAGTAVAREAMLAFPAARSFACVCGGGSNGGDGRVAARVLREAGHVADETNDVDGYDVVIDALFGTGFRGEPRPEAAELIERMNAADAPVVSVDVPSGVDASTGEIAGAAVEAELTVTFHAPKVGLVRRAGPLPRRDASSSPTSASRTARPSCAGRPPRSWMRSRAGARATRSTPPASVLVVGGQPGMTSAACLAAMAAFRADAGYVALAVPEESLADGRGARARAGEDPVARRRRARDDPRRGGARERTRARARARAGRERAALSCASSSSEIDLPAVVDADALFELEPVERDAPTVLTPHAGELGRLLGRDSDWVDAHRLAAAREAAERFGAVVLLKGTDTIVASPDGRTVVSDHGPPSLATAGTGDVLTGVVAAFLAKGVEPATAAAAAAVAHGLAGASAPTQAGLVASDLLDLLPRDARTLTRRQVPAGRDLSLFSCLTTSKDLPRTGDVAAGRARRETGSHVVPCGSRRRSPTMPRVRRRNGPGRRARSGPRARHVCVHRVEHRARIQGRQG